MLNTSSSQNTELLWQIEWHFQRVFFQYDEHNEGVIIFTDTGIVMSNSFNGNDADQNAL